jgi:hypothetical protein
LTKSLKRGFSSTTLTFLVKDLELWLCLSLKRPAADGERKRRGARRGVKAYDPTTITFWTGEGSKETPEPELD